MTAVNAPLRLPTICTGGCLHNKSRNASDASIIPFLTDSDLLLLNLILDKKLQIAVYLPSNLPTSIRNYSRNVMSRLADRGVQFCCFNENSPLPKDVDLYWDPTASDGGEAFSKLQRCALGSIRRMGEKVVVTQHSATAFSTPMWLYYSSLRSALSGEKWKIRKRIFWKDFTSYAKVIVPSNYAKWEVTNFLPIDERKVEVIYHGVDKSIFRPKSNHNEKKRYFLHVSNWQPVKNVARLIKAYQRINIDGKPRLKLIVPQFKGHCNDPNIDIIRDFVSHEEISKYYQGAYAYLFPSIVESFGLPILEAMACGCPVITSNSSACAEIAGGAAVLIDPMSVVDLRCAMETLISDVSLRDELAQEGLRRVDEFCWSKTAEHHYILFKSLISIVE